MGGDAIGRQRDPAGAESASDGRATFVPLAAPGERVRARIEREKGRAALGRADGDRAPERGAGGGAVSALRQLRGLPVAARHDRRAAGGQEGDRRARARNDDPGGARGRGPTVRLPRDRAKLTVGQGGALGFHARRSHAVVDLGDPPRCPLFGPELARALPALRALARGLAPGIELEVQTGAEGIHLNVSHADAVSAAHARREIDRLNVAGVVGLALAGKPTLGRADVDVAEPGSPPLAIPGGGFAQVGRAANAALVAAVLDAVGPDPGIVLEMYAGAAGPSPDIWPRARGRGSSPATAIRRRSSAAGGTLRAPSGRRARPPTPPTPSSSILHARGPTAPT